MITITDRSLWDADASLRAARSAQLSWANQTFKDRGRYFRRLRGLIASNALPLAEAAAGLKWRPVSEKLASEVVPLADTCRWLEKRPERVLRPRSGGTRHRPLWLQGVSFQVHRRPWGTVLIIGPANYPLFIPGAQILHALAAGNAVLFKPAPGTETVAAAFAELAYDAALDPLLLQLLPSGEEFAIAAIRAGVSKIIFTGRSENGQNVLAEAAIQNTPAVMELSGDDACLVLADADLELVIRCLQFSSRWNDGDTCMAPRRLIVVEPIAAEFLAKLQAAPGISRLPIRVVPDEKTAVAEAEASSFGLGISIFSSDLVRARLLASKISSGVALINDVIVPTADPRMPFGGVKASGFGVTRGDEGLLEMTFPQVIAARRGGFRPHLAELNGNSSNLFTAFLFAAHGEPKQRIRGIRELFVALVAEAWARRIRK